MFDNLMKRLSIWRLYYNDYKFNLRYYLETCKDSKDKSDAKIMLLMHALEKGISFSESGEGREFGAEKATRLADLLELHEKKFGIDEQFITAVNILRAYVEDPNSTRTDRIRAKITNLLDRHKEILGNGLGGIKPIKKPQLDLSPDQVLELYQSRSSVRAFSQEHITNNQILFAKKIASLTPSACNRQASRIHTISNKQQIQVLLDNQLGDQGWCNNADLMFIVTSVASYFGNSFERNEPYIDGGMYAMNFVMGLHSQGIASCFKMYVREPDRDAAFRRLAAIPENEIPIVLILAGHYTCEPVVSPLSHRNAL